MRKVFLIVVGLSSICHLARGEDEAPIPMVPPPYLMIPMPKQTTADKALTAKVKLQLSSQFEGFGHGQNLIFSKHGVITLHGKVNSRIEAEQIVSTASKIEGVSHINNYLVVQGDLENK